MSIISQAITESQNKNYIKSENPKLRRFWASRARRRRYTVLLVAIVATGAVLFGLLPYFSGSPLAVLGLMPAFCVIMGVMVVLAIQLNLFTRMGVGYRNLDERQRIEMDRATRIGHHFTSVLLLGTFFVLAITTTFSPEHVVFPEEFLLPLLWIMVLAHSYLPTCYLAWTQPDEVLEEDESTEAGT